MNIQKQIKSIREQKGFSQRDLGLMAGVTQTLVCRAEGGQNITLNTAQKMLGCLGYELAVIPLEKKEGGKNADNEKGM